jgi:lipopolysaccharide biosynthesis regulator YciM
MRGSAAPKGEIERARKLFTRAAELDPTSARALAGLGATYVISDDDPTPGIKALEKSLSLAAGQDDAAVNLAQLYARTGRRAEASKVFESVSASRTPEQVREAREALLSADLDRAQTLLEQDKAAEALPILKSVAEQTSNDALKAKLTHAIGEIEGRAAAEKQAREINRAIDFAGKGKFADALAVIDAILPQITDPELRENTKNLRAEVERTSKQKKK